MNHEYTILGGINRAKVGRYLSVIAAFISATIVFILLSAVDIAKNFGLSVNLTPSILSLISAGAVFSLLYWFLENYAWKWGVIGKFLKVPDLSGTWHCDGQTINPDGTHSYKWKAKVTIVQSWDKIRVRLTTEQSGSNSNSAALICDDADGYRLFYSYKNDPQIGEVQISSHRGFAEIVFNRDLTMGKGEYFNGYGRYTFGQMRLRRN
jgi:hypothetical protein